MFEHECSHMRRRTLGPLPQLLQSFLPSSFLPGVIGVARAEVPRELLRLCIAARLREHFALQHLYCGQSPCLVAHREAPIPKEPSPGLFFSLNFESLNSELNRLEAFTVSMGEINVYPMNESGREQERSQGQISLRRAVVVLKKSKKSQN